MKKVIAIAAMLLLGAFTALYAVPANPAKYKYTQPDGTVIVLQNHGDEYCHWTTNEAGEVVELGADGFYRPTGLTPAQHLARFRKNALQRRRWSSYEDPNPTNFGDRKVLCIIANWSDLSFVIDNPHEKFSNMLNQEGYDYNGAIGSVREYYIDNSLGQYRPTFDVYGPVTLSKTMAYYSANGDDDNYKVDEAIREAYEMLKDQINIDDYDTDNDGYVDMILFYYPGHNPAEGGPADNIWPHQGSDNFGMLGTKGFNRYFCTSELRGSSGEEMCPIGTTCHEFAHSLGLPDFYDTDYATNGKNEFTTGYFDLMCSGSYNDNGRRPPYLSALERNMLGWMPNMSEIGPGNVVLEPVQENHGYISRAKNEGEYFVLECRNGEKWDSYFGAYNIKGLLVYHVDRSNAYNVYAGYSGAFLWEETNAINAFGGHPCYYLLPSYEPNGWYTWPNVEAGNQLSLYDWTGSATGVSLSEIAFDGTKISFAVSLTRSRQVNGYVMDTGGNPIAGAEIAVSQSAHKFASAPAHLSTDVLGTTDAYGYYDITLPAEATTDQIITAWKDGYVAMSVNVPVAGVHGQQNFYLNRLGEGGWATLQYYDPNTTSKYVYGGFTGVAAGIYYEAADLEALGVVGGTLESITIQANGSSYDRVGLFVAEDGELVQGWNITSAYDQGYLQTFTVGQTGYVIPEGKDLIIGYLFTGLTTDQKPIVFAGPYETNKAGVYLDLGNEAAGWNHMSGYSPIVGAMVSKVEKVTLPQLGFACIVLDESGIPTAVAPADKTLYRVEWTLDGAAVEAPVVPSTLPAGAHSYRARLIYYDGSSERVYYDFEN